MPAILTITFNPCIDKSITVPLLQPEKKLSCSISACEPGGGGINVARAIVQLGGEAKAIYPAGGCTGEHFNDLLRKANVPSQIIPIQNETRENIILTDLSSGLQYRFGMPGPQILEEEWKLCLNAINTFDNVEYIVASGSLSPGIPTDIFAQLAVIAKNRSARLVVDTSGEALAHAVNEGVFLLKPNLGELSSLVGQKELTEDQVEEEARQLIQNGHCEIIVVSMGARGAMLISANETWRAIPPIVQPVSTVGAGDSMLAGIVLSLSKKKNLCEALQFGIACGSAATLHPGTGLCRIEDVNQLINRIKIFDCHSCYT
jgi:6-phosphofructokinase 2